MLLRISYHVFASTRNTFLIPLYPCAQALLSLDAYDQCAHPTAYVTLAPDDTGGSP
jgi:hypothetical protein